MRHSNIYHSFADICPRFALHRAPARWLTAGPAALPTPLSTQSD